MVPCSRGGTLVMTRSGQRRRGTASPAHRLLGPDTRRRQSPTPLPARDPSGLLEPGAGKLARPVLMGPRRSNASGLSDRMIRGPVVTRKNARGSHNGDAARPAAVVRTATATVAMAGLNVLTWLAAYLDACGRNGGTPSPARTSTDSCPGTPPRRPARLGATTHEARLKPTRKSPRRRPREPPRRLLPCSLTGLPST